VAHSLQLRQTPLIARLPATGTAGSGGIQLGEWAGQVLAVHSGWNSDDGFRRGRLHSALLHLGQRSQELGQRLAGSRGGDQHHTVVYLNEGIRRITLGADKAFDAKDFVQSARRMKVTVHVTKNEKGRRSNLDRRTTRHVGYAVSLSRRWLVEKGFAWLKQTGPMRQVKLRGLHKVDWLFVFSCAAHNLCRLPRLIAQSAV
jgi:hypothetical protein